MACALLFTSCTSTAVYYHDVKPADGTDAIMTYESVDKIEYTDWTKTALITSLITGGVALLLGLVASASADSDYNSYNSGSGYNGGYSLHF